MCSVECARQLAAVQALLDEMGAEKGCLAVNQDGQCIIGRQEAFYIYTPDGRGPCFVFEGGLEDVQAAQSHPPAAVQVCRKKVALQVGQFPGLLACCAWKERDRLSCHWKCVRICHQVCIIRHVRPLLCTAVSFDSAMMLTPQAALCLSTGHP